MNNLIVHGECSQILLANAPNLFDLAVFSPPYDQLRDYDGYVCDLHQIGKALFHTIKPGGIVAMVIQDQTNNRIKSLTTFRTIMDWCDNIGFGLWECLIYNRGGRGGAAFEYRFRIDHEYIPIFLKGNKPNYFSKDSDALKIPCKTAGELRARNRVYREKDGSFKDAPVKTTPETKCIGTIWTLHHTPRAGTLKYLHPATFPDRIPHKLISAFTRPGDSVLDPMVGSGSTGVAATILKRDFVGIDISRKYCEIAKQRIDIAKTNPKLS